MRFIRFAAMVLGLVMVMASPAWAPNCASCLKLHPIDSGHWEANMGLPDSKGDADLGLVRAIDNPDLHPEAKLNDKRWTSPSDNSR
jgi:hypothetical protein